VSINDPQILTFIKTLSGLNIVYFIDGSDNSFNKIIDTLIIIPKNNITSIYYTNYNIIVGQLLNSQLVASIFKIKQFNVNATFNNHHENLLLINLKTLTNIIKLFDISVIIKYHESMGSQASHIDSSIVTNENMIFNTTLFLFDRSQDLISPLSYSSNYEHLLNDVLYFTDYNLIQYLDLSDGNTTTKLNNNLLNLNIFDAIEYATKQIAQIANFKDDIKSANISTLNKSMSVMKNMVETKKYFTEHITYMEEIINKYGQRKYNLLTSFYDELMTINTAKWIDIYNSDKSFINEINDPVDLYRIYILYYSLTNKVLKHSKFSGDDFVKIKLSADKLKNIHEIIKPKDTEASKSKDTGINKFKLNIEKSMDISGANKLKSIFSKIIVSNAKPVSFYDEIKLYAETGTSTPNIYQVNNYKPNKLAKRIIIYCDGFTMSEINQFNKLNDDRTQIIICCDKIITSNDIVKKYYLEKN
jgi:hypothetical protein